MLKNLKAMWPVVTLVLIVLFGAGIAFAMESGASEKEVAHQIAFHGAVTLFMVYATAVLGLSEAKSSYQSSKYNKRSKQTKTSKNTKKSKPSAPRLPKEGPVTIHVRNLASDVFETHLREIFSKYGEVNSVRIIADKETGDSKGYGFIEMSKPAEAGKAIEGVNGTDLSGKAINVTVAKSRRPKNKNYTKKS
ncbi:splicing factor, CC1-like family [Sedimentisphaera cyanobacteriorum]|uniref:Splicing factor, CC1-like family n=1 Tax=Sedimentisphaera cyanobacteriorum TaxID=1940790 RepID=A0A1Q2HMW2_9BACT|nr:RNA-binding protein [Sedimentisphaera cyanobacteriorum]AQQ08807.1 splicing factor, CC1-like family [Sedimentisphaera cyanobacteriorum]